MKNKTFIKEEDQNLHLTFLNKIKSLFFELKARIQQQEYPLREIEINRLILEFMNIILFSFFLLSTNGKKPTKDRIRALLKENSAIWLNTDRQELFKHSNIQKIIEEDLINFYLKYDYTLDEFNNSKALNITPEILGSIYELLIEINEKNDFGIFYTPKYEAEVMCKLSLMEYLEDELPSFKRELIYYKLWNENDQRVDKIQNLNDNLKEQIINKLLQCRIIDPSCGSGAFVLVVGEILFSLIKKLNKKSIIPINDLELKQKIIINCIFGMDVKKWALIVTQQRLLLWLLNKTPILEIKEDSIRNLPNLDLNFHLTDSLLSSSLNYQEKKVWNKNSSVLKEKLLTKIMELKKLKEIRVFSQKENKIKLTNQIELKKLEINQSIIKELKSRTEEKIGIKNIDGVESFFTEVFATKSGFDIVIGNPPYINQLSIDSPFKNSEDITEKSSKTYKEEIYAKMEYYWDKNYLKDGNSDYYVYFFYFGLHILKPTGIIAFLSSRSWLEVDFGIKLQKFLYKHSNLLYLIDSHKKKSFEAAINTIITIFSKKSDSINNDKSSFNKNKNKGLAILLKDSFKKFLNDSESDLNNYFSAKTSFEDENAVVRVLMDEFQASKLSTLHKPEKIRNILNNQGLVPLKHYFNIERGLTTGANKFFIVSNTVDLEPEYLVQIVKSSKNIAKIIFDVNNSFLVSLPKEKSKLSIKANNYIAWGENVKLEIQRGSLKGNFIIGFQNKPMLKAKNCWYFVNFNIGDLIFFKHIYKRLITVNNTSKYAINNVLYNLFFTSEKNKIKRDIFCSILNSSLIWIMVELIGQSNLGEGAVVLNSNAVKNISIPKIEDLSTENSLLLKNIYSSLSSRAIGTYFEELGIDEKKLLANSDYIKNFTFKKILKDRLSLDKIVFQNLLNYSQEEHLSIYKEFLMLVRARLLKRITK